MSKIMLIAITGGLGSGKSYIRHKIEGFGYKTFDCDSINAELLKKSNIGYKQIIEVIPEGILDKTKEIDKIALARIIFNDRNIKKRVENILHPLIFDQILQYQSLDELVFVEVPLLFEAKWEHSFDFIVLVYANKKIRADRARTYKNMDSELVINIIHHQISLEAKINMSDFIIKNEPNDDIDIQIHNLIETLVSRK